MHKYTKAYYLQLRQFLQRWDGVLTTPQRWPLAGPVPQADDIKAHGRTAHCILLNGQTEIACIDKDHAQAQLAAECDIGTSSGHYN